MSSERTSQFPVGAAVTEGRLINDLYTVYEELRRSEPVSWIDALKMWYVADYEDVSRILMDDRNFVNGSDHSTIFDTFGQQILSIDGTEHRRLKIALRAPFRPNNVIESLSKKVDVIVDELISGFCHQSEVEVREHFGRRLPVQTMLKFFGLPAEDEANLRAWYDSFERALSNFHWDDAIRKTAHDNAQQFRAHISRAIERVRNAPDDSLTSALVHADPKIRLSDVDIKHNASIIFFGGISTVEALILNSIWAFSKHPGAMEEIRSDWSLLPNAIEEVVRWHSPVQSATRHVVSDVEFNGVQFKKGDTVNCMLGAANRDPRVFENPDRFYIHREFPRSRPHIGFATGPHTCLGLHVARLEARIGLQKLYEQLPGLRMNPDKATTPRGYEFHQPEAMHIIWDKA